MKDKRFGRERWKSVKVFIGRKELLKFTFDRGLGKKGAIHRELYTRPSLNIDTLPDRSTDLWLQSDSLLVAFEILLWIATFFSPFHVFPLYFSPFCILFVHPDDNFSDEKKRYLGYTTREIYGKHGEVANNVSKHIVILHGILRYICCIICTSSCLLHICREITYRSIKCCEYFFYN